MEFILRKPLGDNFNVIYHKLRSICCEYHEAQQSVNLNRARLFLKNRDFQYFGVYMFKSCSKKKSVLMIMFTHGLRFQKVFLQSSITEVKICFKKQYNNVINKY